MPAMHSRISGALVTSGWTSQRAAASSSSATSGAEPSREGSTPAAVERSQESAIGVRTLTTWSPPTKRSQAARSSRARCAGSVVESIANQGLRIVSLGAGALPSGLDPRYRCVST